MIPDPKIDVFDLGKGQTTTPGTPSPTLLRIVIFVTRFVRRDLRVTLFGGMTKGRNGMAEHTEYSKTRNTRNILKYGIHGIF